MPNITLPDHSVKTFANPVTVAEVAARIGAGLAKTAIAARLNDRLVDTSYLIENDAALTIITEKDPAALDVIRHSSAHLLAQAVKDIFPSAQVTIGPVIEDGFYYDFAHSTPFTQDDLALIEKRMEEIAGENYSISRSEISRDEAIQLFRDMGEDYKVEIIENLPEDEILTIYKQNDFIDLCRGPHVPSTGFLKAFKLTKLAGAYWRGDANNEMLQRIYGTAFANKKELTAYLAHLEEAEKRDHRKLAKKMDLFHIQEEAPGMIFWHANGWVLYRIIQDYIRSKLGDDYQEIHTPQLVDRSLWEKSGHWAKFGNEMFVTESENRTYAVKPMNCPCHVQVFNKGLKSYRDLPIRFAEFGSCHRNEPSGTLHGLMRVRNFVQDDAHIFCTPEQIALETKFFIKLLMSVYEDFGFTDIQISLSTRPDNRVGSDEIWDKAEAALEQILNELDLAWTLQPGEGAFYGPKIEFKLRDCLSRVWQCGTLQLDFSMPELLGAKYIAEDGSKQTPVMLHRAIVGSLERFIGILIEHYAGNLPLWLAPEQIMILSIADRHHEYAHKIAQSLKNLGFRVQLDLRNEKIGFKIREHTIKRVPYLAVIGDNELSKQQISLRKQNGEEISGLSLDELIIKLQSETASD